MVIYEINFIVSDFGVMQTRSAVGEGVMTSGFGRKVKAAA
jgi:hypothetical protein